jgi:hypothetical protein
MNEQSAEASNASLKRIAESAAILNITMEQALGEKAQELGYRAFSLIVPNKRLRPSQALEYLELILGSSPDPELLDRISISQRGPRLTTEERIALERQQNGRCALCGRILERGAHPHVDHIVPVALGGKSVLANYQLLCADCNLGKGRFPGWEIGIPFEPNRVTSRLRYCVLARDRGHCQEDGCIYYARNAFLVVRFRVAEGSGGRPVFDNLETLCERHATERDARIRRRSLSQLRLARMPATILR